jgi:hypothetical protein
MIAPTDRGGCLSLRNVPPKTETSSPVAPSRKNVVTETLPGTKSDHTISIPTVQPSESVQRFVYVFIGTFLVRAGIDAGGLASN